MLKGLMGTLAEDLFSDENRDELIKEINEDVDIPLLNEKTEEKILLALWKLIKTFFFKKLGV
ncbi:MAG: hypothetical protein CMF74_18090 [Maricaulis sp.]|jgi:hypothetical protein|nr:hypothetical protein [Maricaulis sp.]|tara:strand:- start:406 stop:591 length:186 start_codon:yes stop_codon:yes gene_type:complete